MSIRLLLFIGIICNTSALHSMKRTLITASSEQPAKKIKVAIDEIQHPILPVEIQHKIFIEHFCAIAKKTETKTICRYIHTLSWLNKKWNNYINQPEIIRPIISIIYENAPFIQNPGQYLIAKNISTRGTKNYIAQNTLLSQKIVCESSLPYSIPELVTNGADINFSHYTGYFLFEAVKNANYTYTKQLLELGANPNLSEFGETALQLAIKKRFPFIIELLLQYNPIDKGLITALEKGKLSIIKLLLEKGNLTKEEVDPAYRYALGADSVNPAAQQLIHDFFTSYT